jgi:hypothetical protein
MAQQPGFWDVDHRLQELSAHGDPLEKLAATVDFEMFRAELTAALGERDPAKGGHPGFGPVMVWFRSQCSFRQLRVQRPRDFSIPRWNAFDVDCRSR